MKKVNYKGFMETLKITKKELEELRSIQKLLESQDIEIARLGLNLLTKHPFYKRCKPKSLIKGKETETFYDNILTIKSILNSGVSPFNDYDYRYMDFDEYFYELDIMKRRTFVNPIDDSEIILLQNIIDGIIYDLDTPNSYYYDLFLKTNTIKNCKDLYFRYSSYITIDVSTLFKFKKNKIKYMDFSDYFLRFFIENILREKARFFKLTPITINIVDE